MRSRRWLIDDYIERLKPWRMAALASEFQKKALPPHELKKKDITDELLEECYLALAFIVDRYGEVYLPIFERLHLEIEERKKTKALLKEARQLSSKKPIL